MEEANSINRFLRASRESSSADKVTTLVMGNQSADLDSMASALTFAYYLSNKGDAAVPLMNIPRTHFISRTEVVYLFGELGIVTDLLLVKENIEFDLLNDRGNLRLVLVDHNKLGRGQDGLQGSLVRILEHHNGKKKLSRKLRGRHPTRLLHRDARIRVLSQGRQGVHRRCDRYTAPGNHPAGHRESRPESEEGQSGG